MADAFRGASRGREGSRPDSSMRPPYLASLSLPSARSSATCDHLVWCWHATSSSPVAAAERQAQIVELGGLKLLLPLTRSTDVEVQRLAAHALANLSVNGTR